MMFSDFIFDGKRLSDFGMFAGKFNDTNTDNIFEGGEITFKNIKLPYSDKQKFCGSSCNTPLSCNFDIIKTDGSFISDMEYSSLMRWLHRPDGYHWLQFIADGYDDIFFNSQFTLQAIDVNNHVGFHCSVITDSPYGYSNEIVKKFSFNGANKFIFNDYSDKIGVIYPYVKLIIKENGNLMLKNESYNGTNTTIIKNCKNNDVIEFYGDESGISGVTNPNDFNFVYPVICNTYENIENETYCNLTLDIEIAYRMTRMVTV